MYDVVVCDPDEKKVEGNALGLLYTALSRGTTLGEDSGLESAVYFTGTSFKPERIRRLTFKANTNKEFEAAIKRRIWVKHISDMAKSSLPFVQAITAVREDLFNWVLSTTITRDELADRIATYRRRTPTVAS